MKKINFKEMKLSGKADKNIQRKLYFLIVLRNLKNIFRLNNILKIGVPAFVIGGIMFGSLSIYTSNPVNNLPQQLGQKSIESSYSQRILKKKGNMYNAAKYKNISLKRSSISKYKKYKQKSTYRKTKMRARARIIK